MKRFLLLIVAILMGVLSFAEDIHMTEVDPTVWTDPHKGPSLIPAVSYDAQYLYIQSPYVINPAQIIIRDVNDNIIFIEIVALPSTTYMIALSDSVNAAKYKIELIYSGHHLVGFF